MSDEWQAWLTPLSLSPLPLTTSLLHVFLSLYPSHALSVSLPYATLPPNLPPSFPHCLSLLLFYILSVLPSFLPLYHSTSGLFSPPLTSCRLPLFPHCLPQDLDTLSLCTVTHAHSHVANSPSTIGNEQTSLILDYQVISVMIKCD